MAKAQQLPSGSFRCRVLSRTEKVWDDKTQKWKNKKIYESFTASTKKDAERMAKEFELSKNMSIARPDDISVGEAIRNYIDLKRDVLSPSTITGYESLMKNAYRDIAALSIRKVDSIVIQKWVSRYSRAHSPKTTSNAHGLLLASICMFRPGFQEQTLLPARLKPDLYLPTDEDVQRLLEYVKGKELEIAILLAAFGPMRRGEICALTANDINGNMVTVNKSYVRNTNKEWVLKQPKTYAGYRVIEFPQFVIDRIKGIEGEIVKATPDQITNRFKRAIHFSKAPHFRFHDLRHYAASIMHALGMPDQYIMERGGWTSDYVMKNRYRGALSDQAATFNNRINEHFADMAKQKR